MKSFKQKMLDLHADTYSLTNDIETVYDKANALVYELLKSQSNTEAALTYQAIIDEYKVQVSRKV